MVARDHPILGGVESTKITAAKEAVEAAEKAYQQAKKLLEKAKEANPITAEENAALEEANKAIEDAKTKAEEALKNLPKDKEQEALKERLDAVNPIEIPENGGNPSTDPKPTTPPDPTDNQGNPGKDKPNVGGQDKDPALENAEKLVKAAEDAETKAEEALKEANKDGVISQEEKGKLDSLNEEITKAKKDAEDALKDLPNGKDKEDLKERLDNVDNVNVPTVTDANNDGVKDSDAAAAEAAVKAAEDAEKAAEDKLAEINADKVVSQEEADALKALNDDVTAKKEAAEKAVNALPDGDVKDGFNGRLGDVDTVTVPPVTDANNDGVKDSDAAAAEAAVKAAEDAEKAAEDKLAEINADKVVSQEEADALKALNDDVTAKKEAAEKAVNALPDGDVKDGFNGRLGDVDTVTVPPVTDANNDGVKDSDAAAAEAAVKAAEDAEKAAEDKLAEINADKVVSQEEADALKALNDDVTAKKEAAEKAVNALPDGDVKDGFNGRLGDVDTVTVPPVTPIEPLAFDSESKPTVADGGNKVILNLNGKATSDHTADTFDGNKATLIFGDATSPNEKVHTLTGAGNSRIAVYNPKLDWDMRTSDDGTGTQQDHAPGWGYDEEALRRDAGYNNYNPDDKRAYFYKWTGASDAADIILVENVQTDPDNADTKVQGMIASEAKGAETKQVRFALDTLGGGNDYIKAKGVGGHVKIKTNDGDDVIELGYMNGRKGVGVPYYDGSNQIDMGEGNDKLLVTSHSGDLGVWQLGYDNASLYYTNAKIDMGEGDNEVSIYHNIIAGAEDGSGNYIRFGGGNDKLTVGGYIRSELSDTKHRSSNIIDLGGGHDTVQVKGGLYKDNNLKFLMVSDDSSEVTFGDTIGGYSSMLMGNGADTVVVNGNAEFGSDPYYDNWLNDVFAKNVEEGKTNAMYQGFYETEFKQKVSARWASANIGSRIDLGNGENTLSISGSVSKLNYRGGVDSDTVTLGATSESRFWMGDGTNTLSLGSSSSVGYSGGTGTDTITINGSVNNNSTFNIGSGNNSIKITGNAEQTWIGVSNNAQGFAQSGNDTVTIGGNFTGKGIDNEVINLGAGQDSVTISGKLQDSLIRMGDGNDSVTIRGIIDGPNRIEAGNGDDVITVTNQITSRNTQLIGGEGNDTFTVQYFKGDNQNAVDGGTGTDTLNITGNNNQFIVGWSSGWTNLWSIEEIVFRGTSGRNTIRIDDNILTADNNKSLYIKNQSTSSNTVDVNARYSSKSKQTLHEDRDSNGQDEAYSYTVYKFNGGYTLYIEDGIKITY
ncbi:hypothetical protein OLL86_09855 [Gallibacterium anatis]|uniref:GA-like domain-containing protein n=1 Tax=Gallibacterium anatis TaxID=750 RepID=UPI00222E4A13|nr:hypothetical protein [Gallibacterium anatis]UZD15783.1 hypothetical protein OLL86_09855 [Gallibacterium anatis]